MWQAVCINLLRVFIGSMNWMSYVSHLTPNICSTVSCKTINIYLMLIVFSWNYFSISNRLMQQFHRKVKVKVVLISRSKRFFERFSSVSHQWIQLFKLRTFYLSYRISNVQRSWNVPSDDTQQLWSLFWIHQISHQNL